MDIWKARIASCKEEGDKAARAEREKWMKAQDGFAGF